MSLVYKVMDINDLNEDLTRKYFPMLSEGRQKKLLSNDNRKERSLLFCAEILARQCLSELCDAPEYSFDILCNPNSRSAVGNFSANISLVSCGELIACAASYDYIGIGLNELRPFTFKEAQEVLTDSEIRAVFSDTSYSFNQLINAELITTKKCIEKFALLSSLKEAYFNSSGRGLRTIKKKVSFEITSEGVFCSDKAFSIIKSLIDSKRMIAVSVIERKS